MAMFNRLRDQCMKISLTDLSTWNSALACAN